MEGHKTPEQIQEQIESFKEELWELKLRACEIEKKIDQLRHEEYNLKENN